MKADSDNSMIIESIDTSNMCSHLQKKLLEDDGIYHDLWTSMQEDPELTAVVRSRQLHIYRNGKKVLILAGKAAPRSSERMHCAGCCQRESRDKAYLTR